VRRRDTARTESDAEQEQEQEMTMSQAERVAAPAATAEAASSSAAADPAQPEQTAVRVIPGERAQEVLEALPAWGDLTTIVLHGGCVFEYKGPFPPGSVAKGFYNLQGTRPGFEGHLRLEAIDHIGFQDRPHAGRVAHALTFNDKRGRNLFKVFLGRDADGEIWPDQIAAYEALRSEAISTPTNDDTETPDV
jgi:putative heme utilization carrier protein HutX